MMDTSGLSDRTKTLMEVEASGESFFIHDLKAAIVAAEKNRASCISAECYFDNDDERPRPVHVVLLEKSPCLGVSIVACVQETGEIYAYETGAPEIQYPPDKIEEHAKGFGKRLTSLVGNNFRAFKESAGGETARNGEPPRRD